MADINTNILKVDSTGSLLSKGGGVLAKNITASTLVLSGEGRVYGWLVNSHTSGTMALINGLAAGSTAIMGAYTFPTGSSVVDLSNGIKFSDGIYVALGGTVDITLLYN